MSSPYTWTPIIVSHTVLAVTSLTLGALLLWGRKGHRAHRIMGWIWVGCMASVALISFAIVGPKGFSWIHGLSVFTLGALVVGVWFARTHQVRSHRIQMISLYVGALLITGLFTLLPGRLIGKAIWSGLGLT